VWLVQDLEPGMWQKRNLLLNKGELQNVAYHEIYRGFSTEVSTRLTGILVSEEAKNEIVFLGELAAGHWFERIFGWQSYWFSDRRWGLYGKYFSTLTNFGGRINLNAINLDLKYRLTPGIWNEDATLGLIMGFQSVQFNKGRANMLGFGGLWARKMPKVFDEIFNILPWFRFPKWVDMEIIYYPLSLDPKVQIGNNLNLTFHGKMQFTPRIYLEAGFGLKVLDFVKTRQTKTAGIITFGTGGLGYNF